MVKNLTFRQKVWIGAAVLAVLVAGILWESLYSLVHNKAEMHRLKAREVFLDKQYEQLSKEYELLKAKDPATMERIARTQYHMLKKGETEFRFADYDAH